MSGAPTSAAPAPPASAPHWPAHQGALPLEELAKLALAAVGAHGVASEVAFGEAVIHVKRDGIVEALRALRDDHRLLFETLIDICGVDHPERAQRFDVVYHLLSMRRNHRLRVKIEVDEATPVPSSTSLFPVADWYEREAFDMYGVLFDGHPDLRRILTDYNFQGHPLRKEFPLTGFVEVRYDPDQQRVVYEPVKLQQAFRNFDFLSPWEGMLPGDEKAQTGER